MRLARLALPYYGHFTDFALDFGAAPEDGPDLPPLQDENGEDVNPTLFQVESIVIEGGDTWAQYRGTVLDIVDEMMFPFLVDDEADGTEYTGLLQTTTRIFQFSIEEGVTEIAPGDLMMDDRALVDAVVLESDNVELPDTLAIALMLTRTPPELDLSVVGELTSVDLDSGSLTILADAVEVCVNTNENTNIFQFLVRGDAEEIVDAELADLVIGAKTVATGVDDAGCILADMIISEGQAATPTE